MNYPKKMRLKYALLSLMASVAILVLINSCKKNLGETSTSDPKILQAKAWYESVYPKTSAGAPLSTLASGAQSNQTDLSQLINPDWENPASYNRLGKDVVEIPIDPESKYNFSLKNPLKTYNKAYSRTSFLILKDSTGYQAFVMMVMADSAYVNNDLSKLTHNTYRSHDADFTGVVAYFTPKGKFLQSYGYKNGQVLPAADAHTTNTTLATQAIKTNANQTPFTVNCYDWYLVNWTNGRIDSEVYLYTTCEVTGTGSGNDGSPGTGSNGGGDGTSTPPICPPTTNAAGKIVVNGNQAPPTGDPGPGGDPGFPPPTTTTTPCVVTVTPPPSTEIINNVNNPCLHAMVEATILSNVNNEINAMIKSVFKGSETINVKYIDSALTANGDGITNPTSFVNGTLDVKIVLDNTHLPGYSQQYIARVIMHESLHAYLMSKGIQDSLQHEKIATDYVTAMATSLVKMFPGFDAKDAQNLALCGLQTTNEFKNTISTDLKLDGQFIATNLAYSLGTKGKRCN